jgi:CHASE3 domain sensor protein
MAQASNSLMAKFHSFAASEGARTLSQQMLIVAAVFLIAALMTMGGTLWSFKNTVLQSEVAENTMLEITTIESRLMEIQGALNGLALTGDDWFQRRIDRDRREFGHSLEKLRRSLEDNPTQAQHYAQIVQLVQSQDTLVAALRQPERRGDADWQAKARAGMRRVDHIRALLWDILMVERAKRYAGHQTMIGEATQSFWLAVGIVALTALMALCVFSMRSAPGPRPKAQLP